MTTFTESAADHLQALDKAPTGIAGFDEITEGGLPRGRPTLVTGASGSGKTLFGMEFLVRGAEQFGEPGVLFAFEEGASDLAKNVASLGFDLPRLEREGKLVVDAFHVDPAEIVATGAFDLEGLFVRLAWAVDQVGAKRVVLDTIEVLFGALGDDAIVRGELGRLFRWLKDRGLTAVVTGERGREGQLTRFGIEEYVSDCVVVLEHRVLNDVATRRLRVAKYRGSHHGTNDYPFLITERGFMVLPLSSLGLDYGAPEERLSTGVPELDEMLGGGLYRGSTALISGAAGTGKTTLSAQLADASCERGERTLLMSFEESPEQILRNMRSVGLDLRRWVDTGLLTIVCERATASGLESHLGRLSVLLRELQPRLVLLDAVASFAHIGSPQEVTSTLAREMDLVKARGITCVLTMLTHQDTAESSGLAVSSLIDTWLLLRNVEDGGERNRLLFCIKSRGTAHSNQVREFLITDHGPRLVEVYAGPQGVLVGSARVAAASAARVAQATTTAGLERRLAELNQRAHAVEAELARVQAEVAADTAELERFLARVAPEHGGAQPALVEPGR